MPSQGKVLVTNRFLSLASKGAAGAGDQLANAEDGNWERAFKHGGEIVLGRQPPLSLKSLPFGRHRSARQKLLSSAEK